LKGDIWLL